MDNKIDLKTYPDLTTVDYVYDLGSRLTSIVYGLSSMVYAYDALNRISSNTQTLNVTPYTLNYQYDSNGNRTQLIYPSGYSLSYAYDTLNRLTKITDLTASTVLTTYSYDTLSRRTQKEMGSNYRSRYYYDSANRLTRLTNRIIPPEEPPPPPHQEASLEREGFRSGLRSPYRLWATLFGKKDVTVTEHVRHNALADPPIFLAENGHRDRSPLTTLQSLISVNEVEAAPVGTQIISDFSYTYDNVGNRLSMNAPDGAHNYGYNDIYELTSVTGSQTHSFVYDGVGNRAAADATTYVPNNLNQYTQVGAVNYTNDANGNLTNDGIYTFGYDYESRLISAIGNGHNASYAYDPFGRRISKTVDGLTTYFIYDGDQIIEERDAGGTLTASYVYGDSIDEPLVTRRNNQNYYYFYDGLGSVTDITNANGAVVESYTYDAYGNPSQVSTIGNRFMFTGREFDEETGLYYYRARAYSPSIGRFLQRDLYTGGPDDLHNFKKSHYYQDLPHILIQQNNLMQFVNILSPLLYIHRARILQSNLNPNLYFNRYLYCSNNPLNFIDPYGFEKMKELQQEYNQLLAELLGMTFMSFVGLGTATVGLGASVGGGIGVVLIVGGLGLLGYEFYQAIDWANRFGNWYLEMRREQERRALGGESKLW